MRDTHIRQFIAWLTQNRVATWAEIRAAGFAKTFNGATRQRLVALGVVIIDQGVTESPPSGAHRNHNLYRIGDAEYSVKKAGRRPGYRLDETAREQMMVRAAVTTLTKRGYTISPPESAVNG